MVMLNNCDDCHRRRIK